MALRSRTPVLRYLETLFATASRESLVEMRYRIPAGMGRTFLSSAKLPVVAAAIAERAPATDVYVGVLPRRRPSGGRADVAEPVDVVWADCDTPESSRALDGFVPAPSIIVASGSRHHCHAYWLLQEPLSLAEIEAANRSLAARLGADPHCGDGARILRPPSLNHKHCPPAPVRLMRCEPARYTADELLATCRTDVVATFSARSRATRSSTDDPLLKIAPALYVEVLVGTSVPRHRKVRCPFHADSTPSLHVYEEPPRGWYCFGCRRGGSVYDLAALLWNLEPRGRGFLDLRERLGTILSGLCETRASGRRPGVAPR